MFFLMKKWLLLKKHANIKARLQKYTVFMNTISKIDTLFMTKTAEKPYHLQPYIPIYSPYNGTLH